MKIYLNLRQTRTTRTASPPMYKDETGHGTEGQWNERVRLEKNAAKRDRCFKAMAMAMAMANEAKQKS